MKSDWAKERKKLTEKQKSSSNVQQQPKAKLEIDSNVTKTSGLRSPRNKSPVRSKSPADSNDETAAVNFTSESSLELHMIQVRYHC